MDVTVVETSGLGDRSYLVSAEGVAVVVDPQRDIDRFLSLAERRGARITHVLETHIHNDYVSGGLDLARVTGAEYVVPAGRTSPTSGAPSPTATRSTRAPFGCAPCTRQGTRTITRATC